ncbi:MAG: molybdopterin-synthase adenylyltransferase MoeB [Steroidobacteraceae bacterium]
MLPELTSEELARYSRHLILPEVGLEGQLKLKAAKVLLVGAGGLGSPTAMYLAASGIGTLGIIDFDEVDATNLHRQVIHGTEDVGRSKVDSADEAIRSINPNVKVVKFQTQFSSENALDIVSGFDMVVDGTDNFPTRYLVNDACVLLGKANVYGSIFRFEGRATIFAARDGPCYRCLYPEPPPRGMVPSCAEAGVLGVLPGILGLIQATETVKLILDAGEPLIGRLLLYDALGMRFREIRIRRDLECPICGENPTITHLIDYDQFCGLPKKRATVAEIDVEELRSLIENGTAFQLIDVREPYEFAISRVPGSVLIPLGELPQRLDEIRREGTIVVHCQSGTRSVTACEILSQAGYPNPLNLKGGILAWLALGEKSRLKED